MQCTARNVGDKYNKRCTLLIIIMEAQQSRIEADTKFSRISTDYCERDTFKRFYSRQSFTVS